MIAKGTYYAQPANYRIDTGGSTWGWWHLIVGLIVLAAGFGVLSGAATLMSGVEHGRPAGMTPRWRF